MRLAAVWSLLHGSAAAQRSRSLGHLVMLRLFLCFIKFACRQKSPKQAQAAARRRTEGRGALKGSAADCGPGGSRQAGLAGQHEERNHVQPESEVFEMAEEGHTFRVRPSGGLSEGSEDNNNWASGPTLGSRAHKPNESDFSLFGGSFSSSSVHCR